MALSQIGALAADREAMRDSLEGFVETDGRSMILHAQLMSEAGDAKGAAEAASRAVETDLNSGDLVRAAAFLAAGGFAEQGETALRKGLSQDRFDERVYESMLNLYTEAAPLGNERKLTETARALRQNVPSSRVIRSLQAQESIAKSLFGQAESQLLGLMDPHFEPPQILDLLLSLLSSVTDEAIASRGEEWLRARLVQRPQSTLLIGGLARVLHARGRSAEAETLLAERLKTWPIPELARLRETILRDGLHQVEEADALTKARLEDSPPTPAVAFEWIELLSRQGDFAGAAAKAAEMLPRNRPLPSAELERLIQVLGGLSAEAVVAAGPEAARSVGDLIDRVVGDGQRIPAKLHLNRVEILARGGASAQRVANAVLDFGRVQPELEISALGQAFAWMRPRSASEALTLVLEHCNAKPDERVVRFLLAQTGDIGSGEDAQRVVKQLKPLNIFKAVLTQIDPEAAVTATTDNMLRADLAYQISLQFASRDLKAESLSLYRLALEFHPRHAWAANNLGYDILESGGDLNLAEQLIELAHEVLPAEASIVDSLAWVRYNQGQIQDAPAEEGKPPRRGALWLIDRAVQLNPAASAEVMDHAGDIFWSAGQKDRAIDFWNRAAVSGEVTARDLRARGIASSFVTRLESLAKGARDKMDAARNGREPAIATPAPQK
jgi:tetratricopeptide (TPR) repeat protein